MHPDFADHVHINLGLSIAWQDVPYQLGGWADDWTCDQPVYERLLKPERRFWVAGDQVSYLSGWQEGAVRSACHVIRGIAGLPIDKSLLQAAPMATSKRKAPGFGGERGDCRRVRTFLGLPATNRSGPAV